MRRSPEWFGSSSSESNCQWFQEQGLRRSDGHRRIPLPFRGGGCLRRLSEDYGTKGLDEWLQPAIDKAENGYRIMDRIAFDHAQAIDCMKGDEYLSARFLPGGKPLPIGAKHMQPQMAETLRRIAREGQGLTKGR